MLQVKTPRVQLIQRIEPKSTIGPTMSVRALKFASKSLLIGHTGAKHNTSQINIVGHHLYGHAALLQAERFDRDDQARLNH